jgi:hypothetical protein
LSKTPANVPIADDPQAETNWRSPFHPGDPIPATPETPKRTWAPPIADGGPATVPDQPPEDSSVPLPAPPAEGSKWTPAAMWSADLLIGRSGMPASVFAGSKAFLVFENAFAPKNLGEIEEQTLASIRAEVSKIAAGDQYVKAFFQLQAFAARLGATRADAEDRLAGLETSERELMETPPECLDDLQKSLDGLARKAEPLRKTLAALTERIKTVEAELPAANQHAIDALREIARSVALDHLDRLRAERQAILDRIAEHYQADIGRLREIHFVLLGGADRFEWLQTLETIIQDEGRGTRDEGREQQTLAPRPSSLAPVHRGEENAPHSEHLGTGQDSAIRS